MEHGNIRWGPGATKFDATWKNPSGLEGPFVPYATRNYIITGPQPQVVCTRWFAQPAILQCLRAWPMAAGDLRRASVVRRSGGPQGSSDAPSGSSAAGN